MAVLDTEYKTYMREKTRLLSENEEGRFALIKGENVIDTFGCFDDTLRAGYRRFGTKDPFMVHQILRVEPVMIINRWLGSKENMDIKKPKKIVIYNLIKIRKEDALELKDYEVGTKILNYTVVEVGEWIDDGSGKYQNQFTIFEYDGRFFELHISRTGSYYSDYYYSSEDWGDEVECHEVEKKEIITHKWVAVKVKEKEEDD